MVVGVLLCPLGGHGALPRDYLASLGRDSGAFGKLLGGSVALWASLGGLWGAPGKPLGASEALWGSPGHPWGASWLPLGVALVSPRCFRGVSWVLSRHLLRLVCLPGVS